MTEKKFIHLDPVEDGKPSRDYIIYGGAVVLVAVGLLEVYLVGVLSGVDSILFGAILVLTDKTRRVSWMAGYLSCARSISDQIEGELYD